METIIANLIAEAIDADKIAGLDHFDTDDIESGYFTIVLDNGDLIKISVGIVRNEAF